MEQKEVIEFCVDFIDELSPIGVPMSRYDGRLEGKGTLGKKSNMHIPESEIRKFHCSTEFIPRGPIYG